MSKNLGSLSGLLAAVLMMFAIHSAIAADSAALVKNFDDYSERVRAARADKASTNLNGDIAWRDSYEMDAYLLMYQATGDANYMDYFIELADMVVTARADKAGMPDWRGWLRRGWLTDGAVTLGQPAVVLDAKGNPSLEIQCRLEANNGSLAIEINPAKDGKSFDIAVRNLVTGQLDGNWEKLTMETVESAVNAEGSALKVRKMGAGIPGKCIPFTLPTQRAVIQALHWGKITTPLTHVSGMIAKNPEMAAIKGRATNYTGCSVEAFGELEKSFVDKGKSGYYAYEKNCPVAGAGKPAPVFAQAATGTGLIYLDEATTPTIYAKRVEQLANYVKSRVEVGDDGKVSIKGEKAQSLENLQLVIRFMSECARRNVVFTTADLEPFAKTFAAGQAESNLAGFMLLGGDTLQKCAAIYNEKYTQGNSAQILYGWALLNYLNSPAAKK